MESSRLSKFGGLQTQVEGGVVKRKEVDPFEGHGQNPAFIVCAMGEGAMEGFEGGGKML